MEVYLKMFSKIGLVAVDANNEELGAASGCALL
jgi:hypothetical protein